MAPKLYVTLLKSFLFFVTVILISIFSTLLLEGCAFAIVEKGGIDWILIPMAIAMVLAIGWYVANKISYRVLSLVDFRNYGRWTLIISLIAFAIYRLIVIWINYDFERSRNLIALFLYVGFSYFILKGFIAGTSLTREEYLDSFSLKKKKSRI
jgi:hypothetical protein